MKQRYHLLAWLAVPLALSGASSNAQLVDPEPAPAPTPPGVESPAPAPSPSPVVPATPETTPAMVSQPADEVMELVAAVPPVAPVQRERPFLAIAGVKPVAGPVDLITLALWRRLADSQRFVMPDRGDAERRLSGMALSPESLEQLSTAQTVARAFNADYVVYGAVFEMERQIRAYLEADGKSQRFETRAQLDVELKLLRVADGSVAVTRRIRKEHFRPGRFQDATPLYQTLADQVAVDFADAVLTALPIRAIVAQVKPGKNGIIIIDAGSSRGIVSQYDLNVFRYENVTMPDGKVIQRQVDICLARPVRVQGGLTEARPGRYWRGAMSTGWRFDDRLLDQISPGMYVETVLRQRVGMFR